MTTELATKTIGQLPAAATVTNDTLIPVELGGLTKHVPLSLLLSTYQAASVALATSAQLTAGGAAVPLNGVAIVYADADLAKNGYWLRIATNGNAADWTLTEMGWGRAVARIDQEMASAELAIAEARVDALVAVDAGKDIALDELAAVSGPVLAAAAAVTTKANQVAAAATAVEQDADRAEEAAGFAEEFAGLAYANVAAGEAATAVGRMFRVPLGTAPETYARYERTVGGSKLAASLASTADLASSVRSKGAALVRMEDGRSVQSVVAANAVLASPTVNALRLGWEATSGKAKIVAKITRFEQPIAVTGVPGEKWRGLVAAKGLHVHIPYDATTVLFDNPETGESWQTDFGLSLSGTRKWRWGVLTRDGLIICIPYDAQDFLVIDLRAYDPANRKSITAYRSPLNLPAATLAGAAKWDGGALAYDDTILAAPSNATTALQIDTANLSARTLTATQLGLPAATFNGATQYSCAISLGRKVYFIPFFNANVIVVDVATTTATAPTYGLTLTDANKFSHACVFGTDIVCCPASSTTIMVINTVAGTAVRTAMGADLTGANKWRAIVVVGRRIIGVPGDAQNFLDIDPFNTAGSPQGTATRPTFSIYDARAPLTPLVLPAAIKWGGALVYKGIIHGGPCGVVQSGQDILLLDRAANAGAGQAFHTDRRALSLENTATQFFGAVLSNRPDKLGYCMPASSTDFFIIRDNDPENDHPVAFRSTLGLTLPVGNQKFQCGVFTPEDECIISLPRSEITMACKIDPNDLSGSPYGTATLFNDGGARDRETGAVNVPLGDGAPDSQPWHSSVRGMDGKVRGVPYNADKVLVYDPTAPAGQKFELTNGGLDLSGSFKWVGGTLHPNGIMVCAPRAHTKFLLIDTNPNSPTYEQMWLTDFGKDINTESRAGLVALKYAFPHTMPSGRILCPPRSARNIACVDLSDTSEHPLGKLTFETFGLNMDPLGTLVGSGYSISSKVGPDGRLIIAANGGVQAGVGLFLVIDDILREGEWTDFGLTALINSDNKIAGAILTPGNKIFFVKRSANYFICLTFKGVDPLPMNVLLGAQMNKG